MFGGFFRLADTARDRLTNSQFFATLCTVSEFSNAFAGEEGHERKERFAE